jgi:alkanesulfonate monooxygenase SsuD/methylene tetrahydromethanopterin reductase-like flavin-dependent oxidoreductase (luciferase family)
VVCGGPPPPGRRRAPRLGDGWYGPSVPLERSIAARDAIERQRAEAGREGAFAYWARVPVPVERDEVLRFREAGFDRVVITGASLAGRDEPTQAKLDALARAAETLRAAG